MKKLLIIILILITLTLPVMAADVELIKGDPAVMSTRQMYVTGTGNISSTLSIPTVGTNSIELISVRLHLSAVGAANSFTITQDSALGANYDTVILTQDMTSVTSLYQTYSPGEAIFDNGDDLVFAWTNGSNRTYGLEVLYKQK